MIRQFAAGLAGLGLIGGVGSVVYNNDGDATVKIKDTSGHVQTVTIKSGDGPKYMCPESAENKLKPADITLGRIELTIQHVEREEKREVKKIKHLYPNGGPPDSVLKRYYALYRRDVRLVKGYNAESDARNNVLSQECELDE